MRRTGVGEGARPLAGDPWLWRKFQLATHGAAIVAVKRCRVGTAPPTPTRAAAMLVSRLLRELASWTHTIKL